MKCSLITVWAVGGGEQQDDDVPGPIAELAACGLTEAHPLRTGAQQLGAGAQQRGSCPPAVAAASAADGDGDGVVPPTTTVAIRINESMQTQSKYRNQMVLVKKGTGKAYVGLDLQSAVHIQRFATVCKALKSSTLPIDNKQNLTEAFLATISAQLFQHYQQCFGKSSPKPRPFTIPPARLFWDFEADGAIFVMRSTLLSSASV
eukprot:gene12882-14846_t